MKAKGITIIAIAYDIDDPLGKDDLKFCASDGQYYGEKYYIEATAATLAGMMTATATELIKGNGKRKGQVKLVRQAHGEDRALASCRQPPRSGVWV